GYHVYAEWAAFVHGWAVSVVGDAKDGIREMREAMVRLKELGTQVSWQEHYANLIAQLIATGCLDEAQTCVSIAQGEAAALGQHYRDAELIRLEAEILQQRSSHECDAGESLLRQSIAIAERQGSRKQALRARTSLANLYYRAGLRQNAYAELQPAYEAFPK